MPKRQFAATRFLERLNELEARSRTPARMHSVGRRRANNSLAGIDFSNHPEPLAGLQENRVLDGERRHTSPAGFLHMRIEGITDGPLEIKKHGIRVLKNEKLESHIDVDMVGVSTAKHRAFRALADRGGQVSQFFPTSDSEVSTPVTSKSGKRVYESPGVSLEANLIPRPDTPRARPVPEPMNLKPYRRHRQYATDPSLPVRGEECLLPDYGHKAQVGAPKHFVPANSRKSLTNSPHDNMVTGSVVPLNAPEYIPLTSRCRTPTREYDLISMLPSSVASRSGSVGASPARAGRSSTPLRHSERKNRTSSPNILAWA